MWQWNKGFITGVELPQIAKTGFNGEVITLAEGKKTSRKHSTSIELGLITICSFSKCTKLKHSVSWTQFSELNKNLH